MLLCCAFLLLLTSCGEEESTDAKISEFFSGLTNMTAKAVIEAEYSDYVIEYELEFVYSPEQSRVTVLSPAEIEGIVVSFEGDKVSVEYDGASFETGIPEETGTSPAAFLPELMRVWQSGIPEECGKEKLDGAECLTVAYRVDSELLYKTWFDIQSFKPVKAELFNNDVRTLACEFRLLSFE